MPKQISTYSLQQEIVDNETYHNFFVNFRNQGGDLSLLKDYYLKEEFHYNKSLTESLNEIPKP